MDGEFLVSPGVVLGPVGPGVLGIGCVDLESGDRTTKSNFAFGMSER